MPSNIVIHWFRQDLRLSDNPSLSEAAKQGVVLPIYIFDNKNAGEHQLGAASKWWLHHSLIALNNSLNNKLSIQIGDPKKILIDLVQEHNIKAVYWNRCYEPWQIIRDKQIKKILQTHNTETHSFNGSLLWEPWEVLKKDGTPYKVFTPYYRRGCLNATQPREPLAKPKKLEILDNSICESTIENLNLLPKIRWDQQLTPHWQIGEKPAQRKLKSFLNNSLASYKEGRDYPAKTSTSLLSPHLHFGEISPNQIWHASNSIENNDNLDHFQSELGWREFSYSLLYFFPNLPHENLQTKFDKFPWIENSENLERWQQGQTGYPVVDAGIRQLWQTGFMHNRIRMIVGSFLVKNLLLHWHYGERWFWDCLVDADLANNSASWQWIAGCGADAAPYFRIFNPITQGKKFDPEGIYTRKYVPELKNLPDKYLFSPWEAPKKILQNAGVILGENYPTPIVELRHSRERALNAYQTIRNNND